MPPTLQEGTMRHSVLSKVMQPMQQNQGHTQAIRLQSLGSHACSPGPSSRTVLGPTRATASHSGIRYCLCAWSHVGRAGVMSLLMLLLAPTPS